MLQLPHLPVEAGMTLRTVVLTAEAGRTVRLTGTACALVQKVKENTVDNGPMALRPAEYTPGLLATTTRANGCRERDTA